MLSNLPKIIDKNFAVGFFLPALLAIIAVAWAFPDFAVLGPLRTLTVTEKTLTDLTYLVLTVWAAAITLMTANHFLYRLLEGYLPPVSWLAPLRWWHRWRLKALSSRYDKFIEKWKEARAEGQDFPVAVAARRKASQLRARILARYPTSEADVLPTRFGNAIRAFEVYPRELYGADGISIWLRLASVVPKDFAGLIQDARAQVNFFMNITYLAFGIAIVALWQAVVQVDWRHLPIWHGLVLQEVRAFAGPAAERAALTAGLALAAAFVSYRSATARVVAWGDLVKSAFDCYLPALLKQLGYAPPATEAERRQFWKEFSEMVVYQQPMTPDHWLLSTETCKKEGDTKAAPLEGESDRKIEDETVGNGGADTAAQEVALQKEPDSAAGGMRIEDARVVADERTTI